VCVGVAVGVWVAVRVGEGVSPTVGVVALLPSSNVEQPARPIPPTRLKNWRRSMNDNTPSFIRMFHHGCID